MDMLTFSRAAYRSANRYYDYLKSVSRGVDTIYVNSIENIGRKKFKLSISKKIFNQDSLELKLLSPDAPLDIDKDEINILEYNERDLYVVLTTSLRIYKILLTASPSEVLLISDLTFLVKATRRFYHKFHDFITYPPAPNISLENIPRPESASDEQYDALCSVLSSPVSYVWGAPGTGKTQMVLANSMLQYVNDERSVLLLAPTNNSLEQSLKGVLKVMDEKEIPRKKIVRLGRASSSFLSSYPEICESSQYEAIVDTMAKELERLKFDHEQYLYSQKIQENYRKFLPLYDEHQILSPTVVEIASSITVNKDKLSSIRDQINAYKEKSNLLSDECHALKNQEEKQQRYYLFFRHYDIYKEIIAEYHENIRSLSASLIELEKEYSAETIVASEREFEADSQSSFLKEFVQANNTMISRIKYFFSKKAKRAYVEQLAEIQHKYDVLLARAEAQRKIVERTASQISDVKARIEQENSIKIGHPKLFDISKALYRKVLSFDDLDSSLSGEMALFFDFVPDDSLESKIAETQKQFEESEKLCQEAAESLKIHTQQISALEDKLLDYQNRLVSLEKQIQAISVLAFGSVFSIQNLVEKFDETLSELKNIEYDEDLPSLIEQKEKEYQDYVAKLKDILSEKLIIACTLDYATIHMDTLREGIAHSISHLFVDEAAYCPLIKAGVFFSFGVPLALFGDHMQLPPICEMDKRAITTVPENKNVFMYDLSAIYFADLFDDSIDMESIYQTYILNKPPLFGLVNVTFLTKTFRFGQKLAFILDQYIYHKGFHGVNTAQTEVIVIDAPRGQEPDLRCSRAEARAIQKYLHDTKPDDYVILAPYKAQCRAIENELHLPVGSVLTVHASQGREWDTVILSVTDARNPFFMSSKLAKSDGVHIINTAVSRVRNKLVLVLDYECWKRANGELIADIANSHHQLVTY